MRTFRNATRELDNDTFGGDFWVHKPYKPNLRVQAPRISKEEWQKHETRIRELHAEGCTNEIAREILRNETRGANGCFSPSAAQYTAQLRALGLRTYNTKGRRNGLGQTGFRKELRQDMTIDESLVVDPSQQPRQEEYNAAFKASPQSGAYYRDTSDTSSTSSAGSVITSDSTPRNTGGGNDGLPADQVPIQPACGEARVSKDIRLNRISPPSSPTTILDKLDDTHVLEDGGPLLTFLSVVDPGFAYEPTSTILGLWPQFTGNSTNVTWSMLSEVSEVADYLQAAGSHADAFDLYYMVFCYLHRTLDTYIRQHLLRAVLNCARSSSTVQQDACAKAVLLLTLREQERGTGDHISAGVLHLYLSELYEKQRDEKSGASTITAIQYLADACSRASPEDPFLYPIRVCTVFELDLPQHLHTSLILQSKSIPSEYASYFNPVPGNSTSQPARGIKFHTVSKHLLKWSADVIASKSKYLNHLVSILTGDTPTMKECIARLLFCCSIEAWLKSAKEPNGARYYSEAQSALEESKMPWRESLSAISFLIVDEAFRDTDPLATTKKRFTTKTFSSHLVRIIKAMLGRSSETKQSFTNTFLAFLVASRNDREPSQVGELSRKVLQVFVRNIISSGILRGEEGSVPEDIVWKDLTPDATDLQEYTIRQSSLSRMLYTPRSSFSSGARSLRALHADLDRISMASLSTSESKSSSTRAWPQYHRSSWSFEMVTGLQSDSPNMIMVDV